MALVTTKKSDDTYGVAYHLSSRRDYFATIRDDLVHFNDPR